MAHRAYLLLKPSAGKVKIDSNQIPYGVMVFGADLAMELVAALIGPQMRYQTAKLNRISPAET